MKKTIIEFVVSPEGGIRSTIKEVKGGGCEKVSEALKQGLGQVTATKRTSEYYETNTNLVSVGRLTKKYTD